MRQNPSHLKFAALAAIVCLLPAQDAFAYSAITNKTDNSEIHVVPAPDKVTIDADLKDWDLSGAILMSMDESSKSVYSVRGAMMYDKDYLYIGGQVKDPTPMVNNYAFGGEYGMAWNADAIQIRFVATPGSKSRATTMGGGAPPPEINKSLNHITLWHSTQDKKAGYMVMYTLGFADTTLNPPGVEGAYKPDADGKGYAFEYRIPWSALRASRPFAAGDTAQTQFQLHWGNDLGTAVRCGMTDVRNGASSDLGYMGPSSWGTAIFEKSGNLKLAAKAGVGRAEGHIPIAFKLEKDSKVSLAICDASGKLIRTCLGAQPYPAGEQTYLWDGLNDLDKPVPAGMYTAKLLTHDGIMQKLVCDVGVSGTPPYQTDDGTGGWAGDYNGPQALGVADDTVVLGTGNSEAAPALIRTDLEGRKLGAAGAAAMAVALHQGFGYALGGNKITKFSVATGLLMPFTTGKPEAAVPATGWKGSLAVVGDRLVVNNHEAGKLVLLDLASGEPRGEAALEKPFGLAVAPDGTLYAVSGNAVGRYDLKAQKFTAIAADLDTPQRLACDADGNVYVGLNGKTMQVWKLSPAGKVLLKYGKAGGRPVLGKFDPAGMLNPGGLGVDKNGRLWVAETDSQPKRYSVWNPDGTLWKDFYGSMNYATTAYVNPAEPEYVYAQSVRYRVDYDKGTWAPDATILRPRTEEGVAFGEPGSHGGATFVNLKGRNFLVVGGQQLMIYEQVNDVFVPRLSVTETGKTQWIDANNDGKVQADEIGPRSLPYYYWSVPVDENLNLIGFTGAGWANQGSVKTTEPYSITNVVKFLGFNEKGGLQYGPGSTVATDPEGGAVSASIPACGGSGYYSLVSGGSLDRGIRAQGSGHRVVKFSANGEKLWEYQNVHCAFAWTSDAYTPGYIVSAIAFARGTTPELVGVTGYYGQYFLLDAKDGLFVDALGDDQRSAYKLDHRMVLTENFNGTLFKHPKNGKTYFIGGDADCRLWELAGLDTMKRATQNVSVTPAMVAQAEAAERQNVLAQQSALGKKTAKLARLKSGAADGKDSEWGAVQPLTICLEGNRTAQAQVGYDDANLYVRFQVGDESPFLNTPTDQRLLFKSGDAVELCLATDREKRAATGQFKQQMKPGDTRLIIARTADGKLVATRYRYVTTDKEKSNAFSVETASSGKDTLDDVVPWNDLPLNAKVDKDGYVVEVAVPWKELGATPKSGLTLYGDLGVIYGNEGGTKNAIRYLWSDKSPEVSINNDIPSEIRIRPNAWGTWMLE